MLHAIPRDAVDQRVGRPLRRGDAVAKAHRAQHAPARGDHAPVRRLRGRVKDLAGELRGLTGHETRAVVLGHLLRGGSPVAVDRLLGLNFGAAAVRALAEGWRGVMVALNPPRIDYVPLAKAVARTRLVPVDADSVLTARTLGIAFGD